MTAETSPRSRTLPCVLAPRGILRHAVFILLLTAASAAHDWNGIARDKKGTLFVVDADDGQIWKVSPRGRVSVLVAARAARRFNHPHHLAIDGDGVLWLAGG